MLMAGKDLFPAVYGASSPKANAVNLRTKGYLSFLCKLE